MRRYCRIECKDYNSKCETKEHVEKCFKYVVEKCKGLELVNSGLKAIQESGYKLMTTLQAQNKCLKSELALTKEALRLACEMCGENVDGCPAYKSDECRLVDCTICWQNHFLTKAKGEKNGNV
jgi:hypothetical protein